MKTLLIMRHAKSSWADPSLSDHQRPLNRRGREAAPRMGRLLKAHSLIPEHVICSTSVRTRQTYELVRQEWTAAINSDFLDELYHCPAERIPEIFRQIPSNTDRLLMIGHNPGIADFLAHQVGYQAKFPTAALAWLTVEIPSWDHFSSESPITMQKIWRPRDLA